MEEKLRIRFKILKLRNLIDDKLRKDEQNRMVNSASTYRREHKELHYHLFKTIFTNTERYLETGFLPDEKFYKFCNLVWKYFKTDSWIDCLEYRKSIIGIKYLTFYPQTSCTDPASEARISILYDKEKLTEEEKQDESIIRAK